MIFRQERSYCLEHQVGIDKRVVCQGAVLVHAVKELKALNRIVSGAEDVDRMSRIRYS